jgi:hypothetical protein
MRASEAFTGKAGIGAGCPGLHALAFEPDKAIHFHYTSGPQPVAKVA